MIGNGAWERSEEGDHGRGELVERGGKLEGDFHNKSVSLYVIDAL